MQNEQDIIENEKEIKDKKRKVFNRKKEDLSWLGNRTKYQVVSEYQDLVPLFQQYYFDKKIESLGTWGAIKIIKEFQKTLPEGREFCPYPTQYLSWRKKWDIAYQKMNGVPVTGRDDRILSKGLTKKEKIEMTESNRKILDFELPSFEDLESGAASLAGELIKDASQVLKNVQEDDADPMKRILGSKDMVQKRNYVLGVMTHVSKMTQGKETINLKKDQGKREAAGFLFDLLKSSTSGKVSKENMELLRGTIIPKQLEE